MLEKEGIDAEVVNMRFVKPIDEELLKTLTKRINTFVTIEDNVIHGGFGSGVLETLSSLGINNVSVKVHGLPDKFIDHGSIAELHRLVKLDVNGIIEVVKECMSTVRTKSAS